MFSFEMNLNDSFEQKLIQSGPEMSSIIRISDGFSAEFLGSFSHSQKFHRVRHAVFDEVAMEALKFGPSSQRPCLG